MKPNFVLLVKTKLNQHGIFSIGCLNREIEQIEAHARFALPASYKEFLAHLGKGAGKYLDDINICYDSVLENRNSAKDLLAEDGSNFILKETDFVFASYQGIQFMYFSLVEGDDPPVYYYAEGDGVPNQKYAKFSEYIISTFEDMFGKL